MKTTYMAAPGKFSPFKIIIVVLLVAIATAIFVFYQHGSTVPAVGSDDVGTSISVSNRAAVVKKQSIANSQRLPVADMNTYAPGYARPLRAYQGTLDEHGVVPRTTPGWYLYAYSAEEAAWLDKHGYPTPSEEQRLRSSSKEELKRMADTGDKNARALFAARSAIDQFSKKEIDDDNTNMQLLRKGIVEDGPYQSMIAYETYLKLQSDYQALPKELITVVHGAVLSSLKHDAEFAAVYGVLQGDGVLRSLSRDTPPLWMPGQLVRPLDANSFAVSLNELFIQRANLGMPMQDFTRRPTPLILYDGPKPKQVLERY